MSTLRRSAQNEKLLKPVEPGINASFQRENPRKSSHDYAEENSIIEAVKPYARSLRPAKKSYEEEKKAVEPREESPDTLQMFMQLHSEMREMKKSIGQILQRGREKKVIRTNPPPSYILTLNSIRVSSSRKKVAPNLREAGAAKIQVKGFHNVIGLNSWVFGAA